MPDQKPPTFRSKVEEVAVVTIGFTIGSAALGAVFASPFWILEWMTGWNLNAIIVLAFVGGAVAMACTYFHYRDKDVVSGPPNSYVCWSCGYSLIGNTSGKCPWVRLADSTGIRESL